MTNSTTFPGTVTASGFTGTSTNATNAVLATDATNASRPVIFGTATTGNVPLKTDPGLVYNPSSNKLTAGAFVGDGSELTGISAGFDPDVDTIAIGNGAGTTTQGTNAIAIGHDAGSSGTQGANSVAVGWWAGQATQGAGSIAVGPQAGKASQGNYSVAMGYQAGVNAQGDYGIAIGETAGGADQGAHAVAMGYRAAYATQSTKAVAIGKEAGYNGQGTQSVAIGEEAGRNAQGAYGIAVGMYAALVSQGNYSVAIGRAAGYNAQGTYATAVGQYAGCGDQGYNSVAVGYNAGKASQREHAVAVGYNAGKNAQGENTVAVGRFAGSADQGTDSVAVGSYAGLNAQGNKAVAIGKDAGQVSQGAQCVAVGYQAGSADQGTASVAIGDEAGRNAQGNNCVAIGDAAGSGDQGNYSVAIGLQAAEVGQGNSAVAIGHYAGITSQGTNTVAVGQSAGKVSQGAQAIAIGRNAGLNAQGTYSVALGGGTGSASQGQYSVAMGHNAGYSAQGTKSVAIGYYAGQMDQGNYSVSIGYLTTQSNQGNDCIAIGGTAARYNQPCGSIFIGTGNIRTNGGGGALYFANSTGELTWVNSDDRIKDDEIVITGAVKTLSKLRPQTYLKRTHFDPYAPQQNWRFESGLMAQEVYYSAPELRHIVGVPAEAGDIDNFTPPPSDDPTQDPDYSAWGDGFASIDYTQFIPYLIKGVKEIVTELPRSKTTVSNTWGQNISGLVVSANTNKHKTNTVPIVNLSTVSMDKSWYGVVSNEKTDSIEYDTLVDIKGDSRIWVTDTNGTLESGDLLTTSNVAPGYTQKQEGGALMNYTVAKVTQDCDFTEPLQISIKIPKRELSNVTYYLHDESYEIGINDYNKRPASSTRVEETPIYFKEDLEPGNEIRYYQGDTEIDMVAYDKLPEDAIKSVKHLSEISVEEYNALDAVEKATYSSGTSKKYTYIQFSKSKKQIPQHDEVRIIEELVDVLDENGQTVWEETGETEPLYTLVDHGTYKAALVSCKLI